MRRLGRRKNPITIDSELQEWYHRHMIANETAVAIAAESKTIDRLDNIADAMQRVIDANNWTNNPHTAPICDVLVKIVMMEYRESSERLHQLRTSRFHDTGV